MFEVSNKVLCVDDSPDIILLLEEQLKDRYDARFATSGAEALKVLNSEGPFAVVISDYTMPGMDGVTFLREMRNHFPDTVSMMLTAHADISVAVSALHEGHIFRFVRKPWDVHLLTRYIDDALEHYRVVITERNLSAALERVNQKLYDKVQELEAAHRLLTRWVQFSPAVIYSATHENSIYRPTYVSPNITNLIGYSAQDFLAESGFWSNGVHDSDRARALEQIAAAPVDDSQVQRCEYRFRHRSGDYRWIRDSFRKVSGPNGMPQFIGSWTDISDLKALQETLAMEKTVPRLNS